MTNLGTMLAGSAIGQGAGAFPQAENQGAMDRQRLDMTTAQNIFQQNQMDRTMGQQQIEDTSVPGATDEDRLTQLADIAGQTGRGDLQRKYQGMSREAGQKQELQSIVGASRAITMGQFDQATQILNKTKNFKGIQSIGLADDAPQDPRNPTYSLYTPGPPDENGAPTKGPHVHLTQQALFALQANPEHLFQWQNMAMNQGQRNDIGQQRVNQQGDHYDAQETHWDNQDNHWQRQDANARKKMAAGGGSGKLTNEAARLQWALKQIGQPDGFASEKDARMWSSDPTRNTKDYWQAVRTGGDILKSGGMYSPEDLGRVVASVLKQSPIGNQNPGGGGGGGDTKGPQMNTLGKNPRFRQAVYGSDGPQGAGWYQKINGKTTKVE